MATKRLTYSGILHTNLITTKSSLVSVGSQQANYPASMLLSPIRSEKWRSNGAVDVAVAFDMKAAYHPTAIAFINPNFMTAAGYFLGSFVHFYLADNSALNSNLVYWDIPCAPVAAPNNVVVYYLDTPTSGTYNAGTTKRYCGIGIFGGSQIYDSPGLSFVELGGLFVGYHIETPIDPSSDFNLKVDSLKSKARGGATYTDEQTPYSEGSVNIPLADLTTEVQPLRSAIVTAGSSGRVIIDMGAMRTDVTQRAMDAYYGTIDPSNLLTQKIDHSSRRSLSFDFVEDNG